MPPVSRVFLATLFMLMLGLAPHVAHAEGGCPAGSYPIGGGTGGWQGCAPIPGGGGGGGPSPRRVVHDNWSAAATHENASDLWIVTGFPNRADAEETAVKACNHARYMGGGCSLALSSVNGAITVARGVNGGKFWSSGKSSRVAERSVLDYCRQQQDYCAIVRSVTALPKARPILDLSPPTGNFRSVFGSAAWPIDTTSIPISELTAYLTTGHATAQAAERAALDLCQSRSGRTCEVARTISDTYFVLRQRGENLMSILASPTEAMVSQISKDNCPKEVKCTVTAVIPASRGGNVEHRPFANGR